MRIVDFIKFKKNLLSGEFKPGKFEKRNKNFWNPSLKNFPTNLIANIIFCAWFNLDL